MNYGTNLPRGLNAEEAEFVVVTEDEASHLNTLPAKLEDVQLLRHKKADANPTYLQEIKDDIKLDIALGLKNQYEIDQAKILKKDIDTLTKSNEYFQVSKKLLNKLFKIDDLKAQCFFHNLKEGLIESLIGSMRPLLIALALLFSAWITSGVIHVCLHHSNFFTITAAILLVIWDIILICIFIACFVNNDFGKLSFNYEFMNVELVMENVQDTRIELPRIAKLKMKEAKDSELFEGFTIAHPEFKIKKKSFTPNIKIDPVILGVTKDSRMYMICWWDIKKDIDKVRENIRLFKRFKV